MQTHEFILTLLIVLLAARLFAELAVRLKSPSVIGELFAGVLLGPSVFGWIEPVEAIRLMAEIGIILLLFEVGVDTDIKRLIKAGKKSFIVAICGFFLPLILGFSLSYWILDLSLLVSLFIGGTLTATSIGITIRALADLKRQNAEEGQIVLGAAVIDDVMGVVLLAMLYEFSIGGGVNLVNASKVLIFVGSFFMLAPLAAKLMSVVIRKLDAKSEIAGLIPTTIVSLVLFFAWLAHTIGAPELLGGFAAGLALSRRFFIPFGISIHHDEDFATRIKTQMQPIVHLFTPIFFVAVGLSLNLREIDWGSWYIWIFSLGLLVIAVAGKLVGAFLIKEPLQTRWIVGIAMIPRGEIGLIFAEIGRESNIFSNEIYAAMIIVIAVTTIFPPLILKWIYSRHDKIGGQSSHLS